MSEVQVYRLMITPQTKVNVSENEKWMFSEKITDEYLLKYGTRKREKQIAEGKDPKKAIKADAYLTRKKYVLKYYEYKRKVRELFFQTGLKEFPTNNVWFTFYVPIPRSWSKKKRNLHSFEPHEQVCDASNLHKSLEDSCSDCDRKNWDYRATKFWCDLNEGYIEIRLNALPEAKGYNKYVREDKIK